jgi:restriction system protein
MLQFFIGRKRPTLPTLILQAIVKRGEKTSDGHIITALEPAWLEIIALLEKDPNLMYQIPSDKWEEIIAGSYEKAGFDKVVLTPRSRDLGRDVIAEKYGWGSVRFVDQVKAYKPGFLVTAEEVRALGFVLLADQGASKGIVTTTSDFAPLIRKDDLIKSFIPTRIELVNGTELRERLSYLAKQS